MSSDESIWRMRVLSTAMPEYVGELIRCKDCALYDREDGLCYRDPNHCGCYRPAHDDGFCGGGRVMSDYNKALLKCLEALSSMVSLVAVIVDDGHMSEQEGRAFHRAYSKWNAAYQDLVRAMKDGE